MRPRLNEVTAPCLLDAEGVQQTRGRCRESEWRLSHPNCRSCRASRRGGEHGTPEREPAARNNSGVNSDHDYLSNRRILRTLGQVCR